MNDYDAVVMAVLEPILVLSVMAVIAFSGAAILVRGWGSAESGIFVLSNNLCC